MVLMKTSMKADCRGGEIGRSKGSAVRGAVTHAGQGQVARQGNRIQASILQEAQLTWTAMVAARWRIMAASARPRVKLRHKRGGCSSVQWTGCV